MWLNAPIPASIVLNSGRMEKGMERRVRQQALIVLFPVSKQCSNGKRQDMRGKRDVGMATMAMTQRGAFVIITMMIMMVGGFYILPAL